MHVCQDKMIEVTIICVSVFRENPLSFVFHQPPPLYLSVFLSGVAASSFLTSGKYAIDPELRGREYERITQNLDVHFWKTFWNVTETELLSVSIKHLCFSWGITIN